MPQSTEHPDRIPQTPSPTPDEKEVIRQQLADMESGQADEKTSHADGRGSAETTPAPDAKGEAVKNTEAPKAEPVTPDSATPASQPKRAEPSMPSINSIASHVDGETLERLKRMAGGNGGTGSEQPPQGPNGGGGGPESGDDGSSKKKDRLGQKADARKKPEDRKKPTAKPPKADAGAPKGEPGSKDQDVARGQDKKIATRQFYDAVRSAASVTDLARAVREYGRPIAALNAPAYEPEELADFLDSVQQYLDAHPTATIDKDTELRGMVFSVLNDSLQRKLGILAVTRKPAARPQAPGPAPVDKSGTRTDGKPKPKTPRTPERHAEPGYGELAALTKGDVLRFQDGQELRVTGAQKRKGGESMLSFVTADGSPMKYTPKKLLQLHHRYPIVRIIRKESPGGVQQRVEDAMEQDEARKAAYRALEETDDIPKDGPPPATEAPKSPLPEPGPAKQPAPEEQQKESELANAEQQAKETARQLENIGSIRKLTGYEAGQRVRVDSAGVIDDDWRIIGLYKNESEVMASLYRASGVRTKFVALEDFYGLNPREGIAVPEKPQVKLPEKPDDREAKIESGALAAETPAPEAEPEPEAEKFSEGRLVEEFGRYGITPDELKKLEHFEELSKGQQFLLLDNFKQIVLGRIETEAASRYKSNLSASGFVGRVWKGLSKHFYIAKERRASYEELLAGGMKAHGSVLKELVSGLHENGPQARIDGGELVIDIVRPEDFGADLSFHDKAVVDAYNRTAREFSQMPYEWSLPQASEQQRKQWLEAKDRFEAVRGELAILGFRRRNESRVIETLSQREQFIALNQFLNENPDVELQLQNIQSPKLWTEALRSTITERGLYFALGTASRTAVVGMFGSLAAPVAAAAMGAFVAKRRAEETLLERDRLARKGAVDKSPEAAVVQTIHTPEGTQGGMTNKIEYLVSRVQSEQNPDKRKGLAQALYASLEYAQKSIVRGRADFGAGAERIRNTYRLSDALALGYATIADISTVDAQGAPITIRKSELEQNLDRVLASRERKIETGRKKYVKDQMKRGAKMALLFALTGRIASELVHHWNSPQAAEAVAEKPVSAPETAPAPATAEAPHAAQPAEQAPLTEAVQQQSPVRSEAEVAEIANEKMRQELERMSSARQDANDVLEGSEITLRHAPIPEHTAPVSGEAPAQPPELMPLPEKHEPLPGEIMSREPSPMGHAAAEAIPVPTKPIAAGGELPVTIRQGEGMIRALSRTLEERYGLAHDRALDIANRAWASDATKWADTVMAGDHFNMRLGGLNPEAIAHADPGDIARHLTLDAVGFENSGAHVADAASSVTHETTEQVLVSLPKDFTPEQALSFYEQLPGHPVTVDQHAAEYLSRHHIYYDADHRQFWKDLNTDGARDVSDKAVGISLEHPEQIAHVSIMQDEQGMMHVELMGEHQAPIGSFDLTPDLELLRSQISAAAEQGASDMIEIEASRFAHRLAKHIDNYEGLVDALKKQFRTVRQTVGSISAEQAASNKQALYKKLLEEYHLPRPDARSIARELNRVFGDLRDEMRRAGMHFTSKDTVESVLKRIHFLEPQQR